MEILLTAALAFLLCWIIDKAFTKLFRSKPQHSSGKSVRLSKHNGGFGVVMAVLGVSCIFTGMRDGLALLICGCLILVVGVALIVYYLTFGIYYDEDTFLVNAFGKKHRCYRFGNIQSQQLFQNGGQIIIELYMDDGSAVQLHSRMTDVYPFLDHAFGAWLRQTGRTADECAFHDPANSCWFPKSEDT